MTEMWTCPRCGTLFATGDAENVPRVMDAHARQHGVQPVAVAAAKLDGEWRAIISPATTAEEAGDQT